MELYLKEDVHHALEQNEFELYYQPQVDSRSGYIVGMEALLRWNHPQKGRLTPKEFIPNIGQSDQLIKIGEWVLRTSCKQRQHWTNMGLPQIPVAVNLCVCQIEDAQVIDTVTKLLQETEVAPELLTLEITEDTAVCKFENTIDNLNRLRALGIKIAIDDFGTSYSSLNYIKRLPVDAIKIDKFFIDGIGMGTRDEAILRNIIYLIRDLNLKAIAEGVETKAQVDFLAAEGCNVIQGFYYHEPMSASSVGKLLKKEKKRTAQTVTESIQVDETEIFRYLNSQLCEIKHSHSGYRYLTTAIALGAQVPCRVNKIMDLYADVAQIYHTRPANVERSIRYCLRPYRLANKEMITRAVDQIRFNLSSLEKSTGEERSGQVLMSR